MDKKGVGIYKLLLPSTPFLEQKVTFLILWSMSMLIFKFFYFLMSTCSRNKMLQIKSNQKAGHMN